VATRDVSAENSRPDASFNTAAREDDAFDRPSSTDVPTAVATRGDPVEHPRADESADTAARGDNALDRPSSIGDTPTPTTLAVSTHINRDSRHPITTPSRVEARSPSARSARRMARQALISAIQVLAHKPQLLPPLFLRATTLRTTISRPPPASVSLPRCRPLPRCFRPPSPQHVTDNKSMGGVTQPSQVSQRPEDLRLLSLFGSEDTRARGPHDSGRRGGLRAP